MAGFTHDIRFALRAIRRAPGFGAVAVTCLAVGIGVNAAAFSVLDTFLLRDLPGIERQTEINTVLISYARPGYRTSPAQHSPVEWDAFRGNIPAFTNSAVFGTTSVALRVAGQPLAVRADFVSGGYFSMLRTLPAAGRFLTVDDDRPGAPPVAVIGYDFWTREFGQHSDAIGKPVYVANAAFTVVGVAPKGFTGLYPGELVSDPEHGAPYLFIPLAVAGLARPSSNYASVAESLDDQWLMLAGRRAPGATEAQVDAQANAVASRISAMYPSERKDLTASVRMPSTARKDEVLAIVGFVMAIPMIILLVACANLANQLLARAVQRGREIAVRLSLGASRARVVRQLLVESTILAIAASVGGVIVARALTDALGRYALVLPFRIPIDARVFAFSAVLSLVTAIAFGLVPALRATRMDLAEAVKEGGKAGGYKRSRLRNALVITQVAASVALMALAGVFVRASSRGRIIDTPYNASHVLTAGVNLRLLGFEANQGRAYQSQVVERLRNLSGVEAVATAPFPAAGSIPEQRIALAGDATDRVRYEDVAYVGGDWFTTRGLRPTAGRLFTESEANAGALLAVVDQEEATIWRGKDPIGQTIRIGDDSTARIVTVIGVVPTIYNGRMEGNGTIITPAGSRYSAKAQFYIRTRGEAGGMRVAIREAMRAVDTRVPIALATLGESLDENAAPITQMATGIGSMSIIALLLAALGLSAVLSFVVEQRRYEIGVRIALGAQRASVTWLILRQSMVLAAIGIVIGALIGAASAKVVQGMLFGMPPLDLVAFSASTAAILIVALLSSAAPARRAAKVDPMVAIRSE